MTRGGRPEARPRFATEATDRPNRGAQMRAVSQQMGLPLMSWQQQVSDIGTEYDPDTGVPAYREVVVTVMRQSGKSILDLTFVLERGLLRPLPQAMVYTAQRGKDARNKILGEPNGWAALLGRTRLNATISKVSRDSGNTGILFKTGSWLGTQATTTEAGHGDTLDLGVIDEAWADEDDRREQAMIPAMTTKEAAQILVTSTAGTQQSVYLRRKVLAGRSAVENGRTFGTAYFEWSFPDDADIYDENVWWECMPGLGHTISLGAVRHAADSMEEDEFARAYGNRWTGIAASIIPEAAWKACQAPDTGPAEPLSFGADATPFGSSAAIVAADATGRIEVVEHAGGIGWVDARARELCDKYNARIAVDSVGPLAGLTGDHVDRLVTADATLYTAYTFEAIVDRKVRFRPHPALDEAAAHAGRRHVGDRWLWDRRGGDITPLVAATWAYGSAVKPVEPEPVEEPPPFAFA